MKVSYQWLQEYLKADIPSPQEVERLLTFHSFEVGAVESVGDDTVFTLKILPDRSSDCLSHRGVARELATLLNVPLQHDPLSVLPIFETTDRLSVTVESVVDCPRFMLALMTDITVKESPAWLSKRLAAIGQRSINNIVDATNFVMYSLGQPLHAYDADQFPQVDKAWHIGVRRAKSGETVTLLREAGKTDDRIVALTGSELLVVDQSTNNPIGLAGVKGGVFAGVTAATSTIILEAGHFSPRLVRQTARRLGIVIDASKRFENEPSRRLPPYALREVMSLIHQIANGKESGVLDFSGEPQTVPAVVLNFSHINALLGLDLTPAVVESYLLRLGCILLDTTTESVTATGPWERTDLLIPEDFISEIARIHGFAHIKAVVPNSVPLQEINQHYFYSEKIRHILMGLGFSEVITSSFVSSGEIALANALASDKGYVRPNLSGNISTVLTNNIPHLDVVGLPAVRVFEIGTVFSKTATDVVEHTALALGVRHKSTGPTSADDAAIKVALAALTNELGVPLEGVSRDGLFESDLSSLVMTLPPAHHYEAITEKPIVSFRHYSVYPAMTRDIALWVSVDTKSDDVYRALVQAAGEFCIAVRKFDEFTKDRRTSYGFRLVFQAMDRTLTDQDANADMDRVYAAVKALGFVVR